MLPPNCVDISLSLSVPLYISLALSLSLHLSLVHFSPIFLWLSLYPSLSPSFVLCKHLTTLREMFLYYEDQCWLLGSLYLFSLAPESGSLYKRHGSWEPFYKFYRLWLPNTDEDVALIKLQPWLKFLWTTLSYFMLTIYMYIKKLSRLSVKPSQMQ